MDTATIRSIARNVRALTAFTASMAVLAVVCAAALALDHRLLGGQPIWAKPLKFSASFLLYSATLAWMISLVTRDRPRLWARRASVVVAVTGAIEMAAIVTQVVRGRASHFNFATPLDTAIWATMGATIIVLWLATAGIGVVLLRERSLGADTAWAVRIGLLVTLLGMAMAFPMLLPTSAQNAAARSGESRQLIGAHAVGVPDGGPGIPLLGWSSTGGDLRIGHFVGMHAMQGLPLLALALLILARRLPVLRAVTVRVRLVGVVGAAWAALTILLTVQAMRGQPLFTPDAATLIAAGAIIAAAAGAVLAVLSSGRRRTNPSTNPSTVLETR